MAVDSFQGKEKDVVVYSAVRSGRDGLGFVRDLRRLNVALTRARHALYIVGNHATLRQSATWSALIDDATERGVSCEVTEASMRASPREILKWVPAGGSPARGTAPQKSVQLVR